MKIFFDILTKLGFQQTFEKQKNNSKSRLRHKITNLLSSGFEKTQKLRTLA